jgi:hypothetical protein
MRNVWDKTVEKIRKSILDSINLGEENLAVY